MSKLAKAAIGIFIITLVSKVLGILRDIILAYKYGASFITDAFVVSTTLPTVIFAILLSGITRSYIPIYSRLENDDQRKEFNNNVMSIVLVASIIMMLLFFNFREVVVKLLAPGFGEDAFNLAVSMTTIMLLLLPIRAIFNVLASYLNFYEDFLVLSFLNFIVMNLFNIIAIAVSSIQKIYLLPTIYVVGEFIALLFLIYYSKKRGFQYRPYFNLRSKPLLELGIIALPMGLSLMINQVNSVVDRILASKLPEGVLTALSYANKVELIILGLTVTIIARVTYPKLNKLLSANKIKEATKNIEQAMLLTAFICIPSSVGIFLFSEPIVSLMFERGSFTNINTVMTSEALEMYVLGLVFYGFREVLTQAMAASKMQHKILKNTFISVAINISLNIVLVRYFEHKGLALATSTAGFISFLLLYLSLKSELGAVFSKSSSIDIGKMFIASGTMIVLIRIIYYNALNYMNGFLSLLISVFLGVITYLILTYKMKVRTTNYLISLTTGFRKRL